MSVNFNEECVNRISAQLKVPLNQTGTMHLYKCRPICSRFMYCFQRISKSRIFRYWYAFHTNQKEFLSEGNSSSIALGCGSADQIIMIPLDELQKYLPAMRKTESVDRFYWHIEIFRKGDQFLLNKSTVEGIDITQYKMK